MFLENFIGNENVLAAIEAGILFCQRNERQKR